jgi:MATE family multidrug resistance protein
VSSPIRAATSTREEFWTLAHLAWPVVLGMLGGQFMSVIDMMMVGRLGEEAIAAVGMGFLWAVPFVMFVRGCIRGQDPLVSQAFGADDRKAAGRAFARALCLAAVLTVPCMVWHLATEWGLGVLGQPEGMRPMAAEYAYALMWGVPGMMVFYTLRGFLQGLGIMRPAAFVMLACNLLNVPLNLLFMHGGFGFEGLGVVGCGWSTAVCQFAMALLLAWICRKDLQSWWPGMEGVLQWGPVKKQLSLGIPISLQVCLEVWAFNVSVLIAGWLGTRALASHMITLNLAAAAFMVPLGISAAATTRVGNLLGAEEPWHRAAWVAVGMGGVVMCGSGLVFFFFPGTLAGLYTSDAQVLSLAVTLLPIAAAFQITDGVQAVAGGVLRGLADVRVPAWCLVVSYWIIGLPVGAWWAVDGGMGPAGIWWGLVLALGLTSVAFCGRLAWLQRRGVARV